MSSLLEIILPVRNAKTGEPLARTVASLAAQTDREFGVLLCDSFSAAKPDPLVEIQGQLTAAGISVRRATTPFELRRIELWNWAHAQSQAEWLKPLFAGDQLKPGCVERLKQFISRQSGAQVIRFEFDLEPVNANGSPAIPRGPSVETRLNPAEFLNYFPAQVNWPADSVNMAFRRTAWLGAGGYSVHLPGCAALNLNVTLALHHGLDCLPESLATRPSADKLSLNGSGGGRVNLWLESWLVLLQARNYCKAAKLPWPDHAVRRGVWKQMTGYPSNSRLVRLPYD